MEYINAQEFLKQPKEVQEVFLDWWKPQMYDLFFRNFGNNSNFFLNGIYISCIQDGETLNNATKDKSFLPLLTEGQLRQFIEEKLDGCTIYFQSYTNGDTTLTVEFEYNHSIEGDCDVGDCEVNCEDILYGYWNIACNIAKEEQYAR